MVKNISTIETSSSGVWQGDNPVHFAFPLLIVQTLLVISLSRLLSFALKPLRQPSVTAEILGGILLGPSLFGRNQEFLEWVFPAWSEPILQSTASIGLLFFLFLVGLELDLTSFRHNMRRAFPIAIAGVTLPFALAVVVTLILHRTFHNAPYTQTLVFIGVSLSITAFPVLARILAELKLLTTNVGQTAMAAAAMNDVVAWVLLALALALTSDTNSAHGGPLTTVWILLSAVVFVAFMFIIVRPLMGWAIKHRHSMSEHDGVDEVLTCLTLAGVMVSGFMTDFIGIHSIFGAFIFGLCIPKTGDFAPRLIKTIEVFVSTLLLPLYFASSGLKTDVSKIHGAGAWGLFALVTSAACAGKILGTFFAAMIFLIPARESLTLGLLMNTKGLVELIVLNIGLEKKVLNTEMFTILVLMALFTTFMTTPLVLAIYKPREGESFGLTNYQSKHQDASCSNGSSVIRDEQLRVLCCVHGAANVPSMVNLIELLRGPKKPGLFKLYSMQLIELTDRSSSILMVQRARRNGMPFVNRFNRGNPEDQVFVAFKAYAEVNGVVVRPTTAISGLPGMHQDICHVAKQKRAKLIILPFHKQWHDNQFENLGHGWKMVNQRVLQNACCSVGIFVDRGFDTMNCHHIEKDNPKRICCLFLGGPNDRKALEIAGRMSQNDIARVTIIRFVTTHISNTESAAEKVVDDEVLVEFQQRWGSLVEYTERVANDILNQVVTIGQTGEYDLIIVGNSRVQASNESKLVYHPVDSVELGSIGDVLASTRGVSSSLFVIHNRSVNEIASP